MRYTFFALLLACASEENVKIYNNDPTATITSHSDGSSFMSDYSINLVGIVSDDNHSSTDLRVKWSSDIRELCPESTPDFDGTTLCQTSLSSDDTQIKLQVIDPEDAAFVTSIDITVDPTQAPQVAIISPTAIGSYYSNQLILFSAQVQDDEDLPEELTYEWSSSLDGVLPITSTPESNGEIEQYLHLSPGQHAISLTVTDQSNKTSTETVAITVGEANNDPTCQITGPEEGSAYISGQTVSFAGIATDEELNNSLLSISWESNRDGIFDTTAASTNGDLGFGYNELTLGSHTITLRVEDEAGGLCTDTVQVSIGSAPTLSVTTPTTGDVYSLSEAVSFSAQVSDPEDIASNIALVWESSIDGVFSNTGSDSNGNISFAYNGLSAGMHNIFVTATDSAGLTASTSLIVRINTPPLAPTLSFTPSTPYTGDDLVVNIGETPDPDGDALTYGYTWKKNGINTSHTSNYVSASDTTVGDTWTVTVTPNDGYIDGDFAEQSVTIANTTPTVDSITIDNTNPGANDTITCTATASDPDGTPTLTYAWENTTTGMQYGNNAVLNLSTLSLSVNDILTCTATATDVQGDSDSQSTSATVVYVGPSFTTQTTITPNSAYTGDLLSCSAVAVDGNNNPLSIAYHWENGGTVIGSGSSYTVSANDTDVGDTIWCYATATDAQGFAATSSGSITIDNTAPSISNIAISNGQSIYNDSIATCSATLSDPDDTPIASYEWSLNGSLLGTGASIDLANYTPQYSDTLTCTVSATDPQGLSSTDSLDTTIENRAPIGPPISLSPNNPVEGQDDLVCSITGNGSDDDGDPITYSFSWMVNTVPFTNSSNAASSSTVSASEITSGEEWICLVTPNDGIVDGTPTTSSVTIAADWAGERVFTNCGQTGRTGPSQSMCTGEYAGTTLDGEVTVADGIQSWTVPSTGTYVIEVWGARAGHKPDSYNAIGGNGAMMSGEFSLIQGEVIQIIVGQKGDDPSGSNSSGGSGGGGGSFVYYNATDTYPLIVAGGGGGLGAGNGMRVNGLPGLTTEDGGNASSSEGLGGTNGSGGNTSSANYNSGGGGGWISDGANGSHPEFCSGGFAPQNGAQGGERGRISHSADGGFGGGGGTNDGGGGGGGYSGGGGGRWSPLYPGGGGGSYNAGTNQSNSEGFNDGHGKVFIDKL